jgi:tetratricopeptide (TPR) repeat protein
VNHPDPRRRYEFFNSLLDAEGYLSCIFFAWAHFAAGRYEEASSWAEKALHESPNYAVALRIQAAASGLLGRLDEGRAWVKRLLAVNPHTTISRMRLYYGVCFRPEHVAAFLDGLRKAGLPE